MEVSTWSGIVLGALIGAVYGELQARQLRRRAEGLDERSAVVGATVRLLSLVAILGLLLATTGVNKYWLTGSLAVVYTSRLLWALRMLSFRRQK